MVNWIVATFIGLLWLGVVWVWFRPEPKLQKNLVKVFLLGMIICIPAGYFNTYWMSALAPHLIKVSAGADGELTMHTGWLGLALLWILLAPVEEIIKFLIVRTESYRLKAFDTVEEGVMLASVSALGFATYENYFYMTQRGFEIIYLRGWLCPLVHMLFSAFFGYYLGLAKTRRYRSQPLIIEGLVLASVAHGIYNASARNIPVGVLVVIAYLAYYLSWMKTERHVPLAVRLIPGWMSEVKPLSGKRSLARPTLPLIQDPVGNQQVEEILSHFESISEEERLEAVKQAGLFQDHRIYVGLKRMEHDPSPTVRKVASMALKSLEEDIKELYRRQMMVKNK
ncbi:MAG: PrsW family intramembrane metalloprotease [bacterium]|nr:PrsW family intramembrane metalloprotease [bacterium]